MRKAVMHNAEPASTREATEQMVRILKSYYAKAYKKKVANDATHLNAKETTQLISLLNNFGNVLTVI